MSVVKITVTDAVDEYVNWLKGRNVAAGTVRAYRATTSQFATVAGEILTKDIDATVVDRFFATYTWGAGTRNRKLTEIQGFFRWLRARRWMPVDTDPTYGWRRERDDSGKTPQWLPLDQWHKVFDACVYPIEKMEVALGFYLFLRGSEMAARERDNSGEWRNYGIRLKHIRLDDGEIDIWRKKTRRWDPMPLCSEIEDHLRSYLSWYASMLDEPLDGEMFLIPARRKDLYRDPKTRRLVAGTGTFDPYRPDAKVHRTISRVMKRAGLHEVGNAGHVLRRSGARQYFYSLNTQNYDGALAQVSGMLDHDSVQNTELYLSLSLERQRRNSALRGQKMFPDVVADNVVPLHQVAGNE